MFSAVTRSHMNLGRTVVFQPMSITANYTTCSLNDTPNVGRYVMVVPLLNKASNPRTCCL